MKTYKQKVLLQKLNKKQKESFIQYGFFVIIFFVVLISHSFLRWNHYKNNTQMSSKEVEKTISYDKINNPDPNRIYFEKIKVVKTVRATGFMKVKTTRERIPQGTWSREK